MQRVWSLWSQAGLQVRFCLKHKNFIQKKQKRSVTRGDIEVRPPSLLKPQSISWEFSKATKVKYPTTMQLQVPFKAINLFQNPLKSIICFRKKHHFYLAPIKNFKDTGKLLPLSKARLLLASASQSHQSCLLRTKEIWGKGAQNPTNTESYLVRPQYFPWHLQFAQHCPPVFHLWSAPSSPY